jgi:hypothetical protein
MVCGVVMCLAWASSVAQSADPYGPPVRPVSGPGYGGAMPYLPGAPYGMPPSYCPPPGAFPLQVPPSTTPSPAPKQPDLPAPRPVDPTKPKEEGKKPDEQLQDQQQPQAPTPPGLDLASASGMSMGLASGVGDMGGGMASGPSGTAPGMIGPGITYSATRLIHVQDLSSGVIFPTTFAGAPVPSRSQFRIADNESPQPQDRLFLTYNFLHNVNKDALTRVPENVFIRDTRLISNLDVHYETFGFEKSFWCNYASIGVRVPFFQLEEKEPTGEQGPLFQIQRGLDQNTIGDVSLVLKYVLAYDCESNNLLSGGLVITAPTSPEVKVYKANEPAFFQEGRGIRTWLFQPWLGYFIDIGHVYVHGFTSIVIPAEDNDVYVWFADIGVGWLCYSFLVPTIELHYQTPVNESSDLYREPVGAIDSLILTAGAHVAFYEACTVTVGLATPLTGPGPFDVEAIAQLNIRF